MGPPDENPIPVDGNPHPQPANPFFQPNQLNHFVGPVAQHQAQDVMPQYDGNFHHLAMQDDVAGDENPEEDDDDLPGWGHWAMGAEVDQEIEEGEFLELADLMQPLEEERIR